MSKKHLGSSYIEDNREFKTKVAKNRKSPIGAVISGFLAVFILFLTLQPVTGIGNANTLNNSVSTNYAEAGAWGVLCSDMGLNMNKKKSWKDNLNMYVYPNKGNRSSTLQEALGKGTSFVRYDGEGQADSKFLVKGKEDPKPAAKILGAKADDFETQFTKHKKKLEEPRGYGCLGDGSLLYPLANGVMLLSEGITTIAQFSAVMVFNGNLICTNGQKGACLDLVGIIGGKGASGDGIVGVLTTSIYYPLLVIAVAITGLWVLKRGIIDRKLREAMFGALWVALSVIIGLALLLNPLLITKAPMAVSNVVSTCVIGAFNGTNCFDNSSSGKLKYEPGKNTSDMVCKSSSDQANINEQMTFTTASITCSIWKAFVLEPLAQGSFGTSFTELDTRADTGMRKNLLANGLDPEAYCVGLSTDKALDKMYSGTIELNNKKNEVCNVLAYQMYLQVNAQSGSDKVVQNGTDNKWYRVVFAAAGDNGLWNNWTGSGMNKIAIASISLFTSGLGTFIIFITSFMALVYYISSVLLMAFAPLFLLIGVHPGRGKAIMLGWLEKVVSNVLKYMASAVFLVVTISIYGGILGNITNIGLTLLFVIIVTMALFMYRNEFMELLGRAKMGGEQISSSLSEKLGSKSMGALKFAGGTAIAGAGGIAGAALTSENAREMFKNPNLFKKENREKLADGLGDLGAGFKDSVKRETKRNSGFVGNVMRQYDRNTVDNKQDLRLKKADADKALAAATEQNSKEAQNNSQLEQNVESKKMSANQDNIELQELREDQTKVQAAERQVLSNFNDHMQKNYMDSKAKINNSDMSDEEKTLKIEHLDKQRAEASDFSSLQGLLNQIRDDKIELQIAVQSGDMETAETLKSRISGNQETATRLNSNISDANKARHTRNYEAALDKDRAIGAIGTINSDQIAAKQLAVNSHDEILDNLEKNLKESDIRLAEIQERMTVEGMKSGVYNEEFIGMKPGVGLNDRDVAKIEADIQNRALDAKSTREQAEIAAEDRFNTSQNNRETAPILFTPTGSRAEESSYFDKNEVEIFPENKPFSNDDENRDNGNGRGPNNDDNKPRGNSGYNWDFSNGNPPNDPPNNNRDRNNNNDIPPNDIPPNNSNNKQKDDTPPDDNTPPNSSGGANGSNGNSGNDRGPNNNGAEQQLGNSGYNWDFSDGNPQGKPEVNKNDNRGNNDQRNRADRGGNKPEINNNRDERGDNNGNPPEDYNGNNDGGTRRPKTPVNPPNNGGSGKEFKPEVTPVADREQRASDNSRNSEQYRNERDQAPDRGRNEQVTTPMPETTRPHPTQQSSVNSDQSRPEPRTGIPTSRNAPTNERRDSAQPVTTPQDSTQPIVTPQSVKETGRRSAETKAPQPVAPDRSNPTAPVQAPNNDSQSQKMSQPVTSQNSEREVQKPVVDKTPKESAPKVVPEFKAPEGNKQQPTNERRDSAEKQNTQPTASSLKEQNRVQAPAPKASETKAPVNNRESTPSPVNTTETRVPTHSPKAPETPRTETRAPESVPNKVKETKAPQPVAPKAQAPNTTEPAKASEPIVKAPVVTNAPTPVAPSDNKAEQMKSLEEQIKKQNNRAMENRKKAVQESNQQMETLVRRKEAADRAVEDSSRQLDSILGGSNAGDELNDLRNQIERSKADGEVNQGLLSRARDQQSNMSRFPSSIAQPAVSAYDDMIRGLEETMKAQQEVAQQKQADNARKVAEKEEYKRSLAESKEAKNRINNAAPNVPSKSRHNGNTTIGLKPSKNESNNSNTEFIDNDNSRNSNKSSEKPQSKTRRGNAGRIPTRQPNGNGSGIPTGRPSTQDEIGRNVKREFGKNKKDD